MQDIRIDECFFDGHSKEFPIGMAYVPWQKNADMYENMDKAYCIGTIFPELYKPFTGRRCV